MGAPSAQLDYQVRAISDLVSNMSPEQLDNGTPCAGWKVRDLLGHLVGGGQMFGALLQGDAPPDLSGDVVGSNPSASWNAAAQAFRDGIDSPGALEREVPLGPNTTIPGSVLLEVVKYDLLVHAWDLAQATNQAFDPPDDVVEPAMSAAHQTIAPEMRNGDTFGDEQVAPAGSDRMDELAAYTGRSVG
jgi:uncharacterized protein (TIGR03086 family)